MAALFQRTAISDKLILCLLMRSRFWGRSYVIMCRCRVSYVYSVYAVLNLFGKNIF